MGKQSTLRSIVDRNVERHLVKEFLMNNTKGSGFGSLKFERVLNKNNNKKQTQINKSRETRRINKHQETYLKNLLRTS